MTRPMISSYWETPRLTVSDSVLPDLPELDRILIDCAYIEDWSGWKYEHPHDPSEKTMRPMLEEGELPPNGSKEFFRLQSIRLSQSKPIIGFLAVYHGYPKEDIFWILYLYIHPNYQGKGYGQECMRELSEEITHLGYSGIRLVVDLKNWPAIRFWVQDGFNKIVEMMGDKVISDTTFSHFILEKSLTSSQ